MRLAVLVARLVLQWNRPANGGGRVLGTNERATRLHERLEPSLQRVAQRASTAAVERTLGSSA